MVTKICISCGSNRKVKFFSKHNTNKDLLQGKCKKCESTYQKENRERINALINSNIYEVNVFYQESERLDDVILHLEKTGDITTAGRLKNKGRSVLEALHDMTGVRR